MSSPLNTQALEGVAPKVRAALETLGDAVRKGEQLLVDQYGRVPYVLHSDTAAKILGVLPANAHITRVNVFVLTAFNSSGTDLLDLGIPGTANKYINDLDIAATGVKAPTVTAIGPVGENALPVIATFVQSVADATTGKAFIYVYYVEQDAA